MGFGKDGKGVIIVENRSQALGALATQTGIIIGTKLATLERFRMLKSEISFNISEVTGDEGVSLNLYLADGDLTLAEIEEAIEADGPLGPNDQIVSDQAMRPVFKVPVTFFMAGSDPIATGAINSAHLHAVLNPRWTFARTKSWNWMIYNTGTAITTGSTGRVHAKNFGVWVT